MKSALIHGLLLVVMLVYGYRTWTRDKTVKPDLGQVVLWDKGDADLVAIEYKSDKKTVKLERRTDAKEPYWWGTETSIEKKPKPQPPKPADPAPTPGTGSGSAATPPAGAGSGSAAKPPTGGLDPAKGDTKPAGSGSAPAPGSGSAVAQGSGAGSGSAAPPPKLPPPPAPVEMIETTRKREFPLGENGDKLVKAYTEARAIRDLGAPNPDQLVDYKLADTKLLDTKIAELKKQVEDRKAAAGSGSDAKPDDQLATIQKRLKEIEDLKKQTDGKPVTTLTVTFRDGTRVFRVGGSVYGGSDRYVVDQQTGTAYVLSKDMISGLEIGESNLQLTDPRGFDVAKVEAVEIEWGKRTKSAVRIKSGDAEEKQIKTWGDADTKKANQPLATFIDNIGNLRPTEYSTSIKVDTLTPLVKLTYKDAGNGTLGTVVLYKLEKAGVLPEGQELDPANPPKGEIEYYVWTEKTHVPAIVRKDTAQRAEQDLPIVFGDVKAPEPKGGAGAPPPFPPPGGHGGDDGHGH